MCLGEKICALRKNSGMTQAELGNKLGVTYQAVSKWERADSLPDFEMMSKIAKLFGVPISYFESGGELAEVGAEATAVYGLNSQLLSKDVLGVCTVCGKFVNRGDVADNSGKLVCKSCLKRREDKTA